MQIKRPDIIKVFGKNAMQGNYLPVKFGTNVVVPKESFEDIANKNFEYGLESLEGDLQLKDLNTVFFYQGALLKYLFQKGIPEFSAYENYEAGAVVQKDGVVWVATKAIEASLHKKEANPCDPCGCKVECENPVYPSKEAGWCKFITSCEYDLKIAELEAEDKALQKAIDDLKGVEGFAVLPNAETGALELRLDLSDGSKVTIPMTKFGHIKQNDDGSLSITNADGSKIALPKFVAEKDLDQQKGFIFNTTSGKWEVDLADLVKDGSGLQVDRNGNISVKPADFVDGETLRVNPTSGKVEIDPRYTRDQLAAANGYTDTKLSELEANGARVHVKGPITGNGKKESPLGLNLTEDFVVDATGKLALNAVAPQNLGNTSISDVKYRLGFHTFTGLVNTDSRVGSLGLPTNFEGTEHELPMANSWESYSAPQNYDFNGYYIASGSELNIWVANGDSMWSISNDYGINPDGTLKNPTAWNKWQKIDNAGVVTNEMIKKMQEQINALGASNTAQDSEINALKAKVQALEAKNNETCKIPCKNVDTNYTVVDTDNTIITTNTSPITITFPNNIPVGRMFTIIQAGNGSVTLANGGNRVFVKPRNGSLVLGGQDAAVTVLYELGGIVRIFGDTVPA